MHGDSQVVRGIIGERPWGAVLAGLGLASRTVELILRSDDKVYRIAFDRGLIVGASSPVPSDSVGRIAQANHFIAPALANEIKRRVAAAPQLDDVDVCASTAQLTPDQTRALREKVIAQRAARTFSVDQGEYEIGERLPVGSPGVGIDVRAVIFLGARMNLSEERLLAYLREVTPRIVMKPGVYEELERYGFAPTEKPVLEALRTCTSLAELEASHRDIDPRGIQAVVYALGSCNALAEIDLAAQEAAQAPLELLPQPSFPDPERVEKLLRDKPSTNPPAAGRVPTVSVTERVRSASRMPTVERDNLPETRAQTKTLSPPASASQSQSGIPRAARESQSGLAPRPASQSQSGIPRAARESQSGIARAPASAAQSQSGIPRAPASATQSQGIPRPGSQSQSGIPRAARASQSSSPPRSAREESAEISLKELSLAQGTPSITPALEIDDVAPVRMLPEDKKREQVEALANALESFALDEEASEPAGTPFQEPTRSAAAPATDDRSMLDVFRTGKVTTVRPNALSRHEVIALIKERNALVEAGADHFSLLGLPIGAAIEDVHAAYVELSRNLRPERLAELKIRDEAFVAQSLLAQIGIAFTVLTDRLRRPEYMKALQNKPRSPSRR